jgi:lipoyl(octanoyl) transferase
MRIVQFQDLGRADYQTAWDYQTAVHKQLIDNKLQNRSTAPGTYPQAHRLLLTEHPPVYTLGRSGSMSNLRLSPEELTLRGIQFFPINRGGDITFHGPGQIVGYPILDLECFYTDVHRFVREIEEVTIRTLAEYKIEGFRLPGFTGVWVDGPGQGAGDTGFWLKKRKICAIGVHLSRWVTLHGFAFNVNTPLEYFSHIVPCGIDDGDKTVTSLARELNRTVDIKTVKKQVKKHFCAVFECRFEDLPQSVHTPADRPL